MCALFNAYFGEQAWNVRGFRLQLPINMSSVDHEPKTRNRRQRMVIRKCFFVNRTIQLWNGLPAEILGNFPCKQNAFRNRVREVINVVNWRNCGCVKIKSVVKWSEMRCSVVQWRVANREGYLWVVKWSEVKWSEVKWSEVKWWSFQSCCVLPVV